MTKNIFKIIIIFVFGMAGGIFANQILWPYLVERPFLYKYQLASIPYPASENKEIIIQENTALKEAVEKIEGAVVGIRTKLKSGSIISGSGLIVTSDGLIVTLADLLPKGGETAFYIEGRSPKYQVLKRDSETNLALVKVEESNLKTCGFADFGELKLGERVFMLGVIFDDKGPLKMVNEGIVKFFTNNYIRTNIFEKKTLSGSPLFNIKGELLGLNTIDSQSKVTAIPIPIIRNFLGF